MISLNKLKYSLYGSFLVLLFPTLAFGDCTGLGCSNFKGVIDYILSVVSILIPILFALSFITFFWGLSKFILGSGSKDGIEKGKDYMFWGILILFVLVSFQAIIGLVASDLDIGNAHPYVPNVLLPTGPTR